MIEVDLEGASVAAKAKAISFLAHLTTTHENFAELLASKGTYVTDLGGVDFCEARSGNRRSMEILSDGQCKLVHRNRYAEVEYWPMRDFEQATSWLRFED